MLPIDTNFILLITTAIIGTSVSALVRNSRKTREKLFLRLSEEGTTNKLVFCSQEILQNKVIGIDGIHRKIMILEKVKNKFSTSIISLDEVRNCELVTSCGSLNEENFRKLEAAKKSFSIELHFKFINSAHSRSIIFYDSLLNSKKELVLLKAKAEYWSIMFSKMVVGQVSMRA